MPDPSGPPDKYLGVETQDFPNAAALADFLGQQYQAGYTTVFAVVPAPTRANTWIILSGYSKK